MSDRARLPQRFVCVNRSVLARPG